MIHNPVALVLVLVCIEAGILYLASHPQAKRFFSFLPSMFWIYFLPMLLSTAGIIDAKSPVYAHIITLLLPPALFLLLLTVDLKAIVCLGRPALVMFFSGGLGIMLGMVVSFVMFKPLVGPQFWSGFGALAGSWTGGSANMIAVKEALGTPNNVFLPMVIVDTIVPYVWMGILVAAAGRQNTYDRWSGADRRILDDLANRTQVAASQPQSIQWTKALGVVLLALGVGTFCQWLAGFLPAVKEVFSVYAWTIILVSTAAIFFSLTPLGRLRGTGSNTTGYGLLYFVLTSIGAQASLNNAGQAGILIAAGAVVILVHLIVLLVTARMIRAPLFLAATASQANIGGVASGPLVAEIYQTGFSSVGLLMAILGNIIGTYAGILTGQICRMLSG